MSFRQGEIDAQAIGWMMRLRDGGSAADWEAFTEWLEADPSHASAYEEAELAGDGLDAFAAAPPVEAPQQVRPSERRIGRRYFLGTGIAAAFAALVGFSVLQGSGELYPVETRPGERRVVDLADGSRIHLNGGTRILLDRDDVRTATLERGEALFTIVHDDSHPFEVRAGETLLRDMGTEFNVVHEGPLFEVAVVEGAVLYQPGRNAVNLLPGMILTRSDGSDGRAQLRRREPEAITGWREGRLTYSGAPFRQVAADLSRNLGVAVRVAPQLELRPFTGIIRLDGGAETIQRAALLMGVNARRGDGGWILTPGASDTP